MGGGLEPVEPELFARVAAFRREHRLPAVAAGIVIGDDLAWATPHGFAELERGTQIDEHTRFRIASITKTFTATAIVQLRDDRLLRLDDPLVAHVPEFRTADNPFGPIEDVTVRRLLTHESGLPVESPAIDWEAEALPTAADIVASLDRVALVLPPDARSKYSNLGYQLLGEVIARVAGSTYPEYVATRLLQPLGMRDTSFAPDEGLPRATGHWPRAFSDRLAAADERPKGTDAEGGLWSTVADLARWTSFQFRADATSEAGASPVIAGSSLAEMHAPRRIVDPGWTQAQGMGWYATRRDERVFVGHSGGTLGFRSRLVFSPADHVGAIVLTNGDGPVAALAEDLLGLAITAARAFPADAARLPAPMPQAYEELLGLYAWEDLSDPARVEWRDDALALVWPAAEHGTAVQVLDPTEDDLRFVVRGGRETGEACRFRRGAGGEITGLVFAGWPLVRLVPAG